MSTIRSTTRAFKLIEFLVKDEEKPQEDLMVETSGIPQKKKDNKQFNIQMFGIDECGKSCSITIDNFMPFFYVKVGEHWGDSETENFIMLVKSKIGQYYADSIVGYKLVRGKKTLYGFDNDKPHTFIMMKFKNMRAFYKAKNLWYSEDRGEDNRTQTLLPNGFKINVGKNQEYIKLYEAHIPPLLRYFHIGEISPSGWIAVPNKKKVKKALKTTTCDYEYNVDYKDIKSFSTKETPVPYNMASYDIEASSSHGDFPIPVKTYKKLANNIIEVIEKMSHITSEVAETLLKRAVYTAFGHDNLEGIELVYPKKIPTSCNLDKIIDQWLKLPIRNVVVDERYSIENAFIDAFGSDDDDDNDNSHWKQKKKKFDNGNVIDLMLDNKFDRESKINELNIALNCKFPKLEGDKVTFIGTTFVRSGESVPYLNHCIVLGSCDDVPGAVIERYETEREVLLAWTELIQRVNPDIMIGYNTMGFDDSFMFRRAIENNCVNDFLMLSRNKGAVCAEMDYRTHKLKIKESSIVIASGQHDINFIDMGGRLQIDLYNYFRRSANLVSYKLDYVAGYFIGDKTSSISYSDGKTIIKSKNLSGLTLNAYIHFEEIGYSTEYYKDGAKFKVIEIDKENRQFTINSIETPNTEKEIRWCLAKDDVTPQDIFRLSNLGSAERAEVAKYCLQDCNIVHELAMKNDIMTEFIEMSKLCSVPISFLVMRGQGIKLTSFIAKKCREKNTLIPVIDKDTSNDGYEGATVLEPKCGFHKDPIACVDYSSLYPSCIISDNLCLSTKVWTKEYNMEGVLLLETGEKHKDTEEYKYDNIPGHTYVNVTYDTYKYERKSPKAKANKIKCGKKVCRFNQTIKGILPYVLEELLLARKATKKSIKTEENAFMKNILDKRQLSIKLTANSLYGQCGAKTSSFYEKDVAASTTAIGRLLLTYAQRTIEEVYGDNICKTAKYGNVKTNAKYIYGDTDSVFFCFYLKELDGTPIIGKKALEITIELAQEAAGVCTKYLKGPHDLEYEKTFLPFFLLSKKRYVGMLYEHDIDSCYRKSMGIVLKRRDNAPIVKDVYGGIIDILMDNQDINTAINFLSGFLQDIIDEKIPIEKLIITKSLRSHYKKPLQIPHKVLADRMGKRDPGNKPGNGDRIPFAFIYNSNKKALQGERIEHPDYIASHKLRLDYAHYITNQIMKPVQQLFALILEELPGFKTKIMKVRRFKKEIEQFRITLTHEKFVKKEEQLRNKEIKTLLFDTYIKKSECLKMSIPPIKTFFQLNSI